MINIDSRLLDKLNGDELAIFCHVLKRVGKNNESFPSKNLLQKETSYSRERVTLAIKGLKGKKIISTEQRKEKGKFSHTVYCILTKLAGVYINAEGETLDENIDDDTENRSTENRSTENRSTENRSTENRDTENGILSINQLSINQDEVINKFKSIPPSQKKSLEGYQTKNYPENTDEYFGIASDQKNKRKTKLELSREFYDNELKGGFEGFSAEVARLYPGFVDFLYKTNNFGEPLTGVLGLEKQISKKNFEELLKLSHVHNKKISDSIEAIENSKNGKYYKGRKSLYLIVRKWLSNTKFDQ